MKAMLRMGVLSFALLLVFSQARPPAQSQGPDEYKKIKEYKPPPTFKNPKMQIVNLGVANWTAEGVRVLMKVNVINPNPDSAKIKEMTYTMTVKGQYLGRGNYNQEFKMEPRQTVTLTLPLDVRFADLPKPEEMLTVMADLSNKKKIPAEIDTYFIASKLGFTRKVHITYREEDIEVMDAPKELAGVTIPQITPQPTEKQTNATASFESVWLDNPVVSKEGERGIGLHAKFTVEGLLNQECIFAAFFYRQDGSKIMTGVKDYSTPSGHATIQRLFVPGFESTAYDDFSVFVPARVLTQGPIYVKVQILKKPENVVLDMARHEFVFQ